MPFPITYMSLGPKNTTHRCFSGTANGRCASNTMAGMNGQSLSILALKKIQIVFNEFSVVFGKAHIDKM